MIIHVREEDPSHRHLDLPLSTAITSSSAPILKVYRVYEFLDTHFASTFFPAEKKRSQALRERQLKDMNRARL